MKKERIEWLDGVRALAVLLVVAGHVVELLGDEFYVVYHLIYSIHMPLFFILSGLTDAVSEQKITVSKLKEKVFKRNLNLLIPALVIVVFNLIVHNNQWNISKYFTSIWFIIVLAICTTIDVLVDYISMKIWGNKLKKLFVSGLIILWGSMGILQIIFLGNSLPYADLVAGISKLNGYLLCFLIGKYLYSKTKKNSKHIITIIIPGVIYILVFTTCIFFRISIAQISLVKIFCGIFGGSVLIFVYRGCKKKCTKFERLLSLHSIEIYLIHSHILHLFLVPLLKFELTNLRDKIFAGIFLFITYIIVPFLYIFLERRIPGLDFVFHPVKYLEKTKFYQRLIKA